MHIIYKVEAKEFCCFIDHVRFPFLPFFLICTYNSLLQYVWLRWFIQFFFFQKQNYKKYGICVVVCTLLYVFILYIFCLLQFRFLLFLFLCAFSISLRNSVLLWLLFILFFCSAFIPVYALVALYCACNLQLNQAFYSKQWIFLAHQTTMCW